MENEEEDIKYKSQSSGLPNKLEGGCNLLSSVQHALVEN